MPFKFHASRRHRFAKSHHRVKNWGEYNESLRRRADIKVWLDESVVHRWGFSGRIPTDIVNLVSNEVLPGAYVLEVDEP